MANKATPSGVVCLHLGRALSRTECGLAVAARAIMDGKSNDLRIGLSTVRIHINLVGFLFPEWTSPKKIQTKAKALSRTLDKKRKISREESKKMLDTLRKMKGDVDRLFVAGASECPKRRTR